MKKNLWSSTKYYAQRCKQRLRTDRLKVDDQEQESMSYTRSLLQDLSRLTFLRYVFTNSRNSTSWSSRFSWLGAHLIRGTTVWITRCNWQQ